MLSCFPGANPIAPLISDGGKPNAKMAFLQLVFLFVLIFAQDKAHSKMDEVRAFMQLVHMDIL